MNIKTLIGIVVAVFVAVAIYGGYKYPVAKQPVGSAAGSTFNSAKTAMINWTFSTNSASSTSVYNSDGSDRIIKQLQYSCTNMLFSASSTVAYVRFTAATSSLNAQDFTQTNVNIVLDNNVGTSSVEVYAASTTPANTSSAFARRWASGSYLTFHTNATSTVGSSCTIGVDYFAT